jgi:hypothetical protein
MSSAPVAPVLLFLAATAAATPTLTDDQLLLDSLPRLALPPTHNAAALSRCGGFAALLEGVDTSVSIAEQAHLFQAPVIGGPGTVRTWDLPFGYRTMDLAFDHDCALHVFEISGDRFTHRRVEGAADTVLSSGDVTRHGPSWAPMELVDLFAGRDGRLHAVIQERAFNADTGSMEHWRQWGAWNGSTWTWWLLDAPESAGETLAAAVAPGGHLHLLMNRRGTPDYSTDLYHAWFSGPLRMGEGPARVATEQDWHVLEASLDFLADGTPVAAARTMRTVPTGSPTYFRLEYLERSPGGGWSNQTIVNQSDNYRGTDGPGYTGIAPRLRVDDHDGVHISFHDASVWHEGGFARAATGQWRVIQRRPGGVWTATTLVAQPGMTQSRNPLHMLAMAGFAVSPGGSRLHLAGARVLADNPPSSQQVGYSASEVRHWAASDPLGTDPGVRRDVVVESLLGLLLAPGDQRPNLDRGRDGVIDAADAALP